MMMNECLICGKTGEGPLCKACLADGCEAAVKFAKGPGKYIGIFALGVMVGKRLNRKKRPDR